jgi:hypothetical protein
MALHFAYKTPANFSDLCAKAVGRVFAATALQFNFARRYVRIL